jgi:hypothetical protein
MQSVVLLLWPSQHWQGKSKCLCISNARAEIRSIYIYICIYIYWPYLCSSICNPSGMWIMTSDRHWLASSYIYIYVYIYEDASQCLSEVMIHIPDGLHCTDCCHQVSRTLSGSQFELVASSQLSAHQWCMQLWSVWLLAGSSVLVWLMQPSI